MKKRWLTGILAGLLILALVGCGSSGDKFAASGTSEDMAVMESPAAAPEVAAEEEMSYDSGAVTAENGIEPAAETGRKLIRTVYLTMQTKEFDTVLEGVSAQVKEMGGYIENSSISGSSYYYESTRYASYVFRIPSERLDEFVTVVGDLGNVTRKEEAVSDVTLQYVDTESRKLALETEQQRLLELLEQAENMEDLLAIESKLSEVRYELENYGSQLRLLDNQIDYSTVHLDIQEVERITETKERTFLEEISGRFQDSLYVVGRGIRGFVIGFIGSLPILAVWAVIIAAVFLILKKIVLRWKGKKEKRS